MSNKKSFILMRDLLDTVDLMTDEEAGKILKAIISHVDDKENNLPRELVFAFNPIKNQLSRDMEKYNSFVEKQKLNGKKGGRPKKAKPNPNNPSLILGTQANPNNLVTVNDTVTETVNDNKKKQIKTSLQKDFKISARVKEWALKNNHKNIEQHFESFKLSCESKNYKYANWDSALMKAIRDNWARIESPQKSSGAGNWELGSQ